ncbi:hypothetical protein Plhal703r1_c12g0063051 [Plasmopara halstedii]
MFFEIIYKYFLNNTHAGNCIYMMHVGDRALSIYNIYSSILGPSRVPRPYWLFPIYYPWEHSNRQSL